MAYIDLNAANNESMKQRLAKYLLGEITGTDAATGKMLDPSNYFTDAGKAQLEANLAKEVASQKLTQDQAKRMGMGFAKDFKAAQPFLGKGADPGFKEYMGLTGRAIVNNPGKAIGLGALGLGNLGGLTDNDKFGGQLGGLALGGVGSMIAGVNPYAAAMLTLGGGELGALFDKLRANKEQQAQQTYYGGR